MYSEFHCHSYFSFHDGASSIEELALQARELGYPVLALTDHDNLCGALQFAQAAKGLGVQPIIGAEVTLDGGHHLTLLAESRQGYSNLCRLLSFAHISSPRREPALDPPTTGRARRGPYLPLRVFSGSRLFLVIYIPMG